MADGLIDREESDKPSFERYRSSCSVQKRASLGRRSSSRSNYDAIPLFCCECLSINGSFTSEYHLLVDTQQRDGGAYGKTIDGHGVKNPTGRESASRVRHRRSGRALVGCAMVRCVRRSRSLKPIGRASHHQAQFWVSYHASSGFIIHRTHHERVEVLAVLPTPARRSLSSPPGRDLHPR